MLVAELGALVTFEDSRGHYSAATFRRTLFEGLGAMPDFGDGLTQSRRSQEQVVAGWRGICSRRRHRSMAAREPPPQRRSRGSPDAGSRSAGERFETLPQTGPLPRGQHARRQELPLQFRNQIRPVREGVLGIMEPDGGAANCNFALPLGRPRPGQLHNAPLWILNRRRGSGRPGMLAECG
jgi:hypothetical protein